MTAPWIERAEAVHTGTSWILVVVSITVVAHRWHTTIWGGYAVAGLTVTAYVIGAAVALPATWVGSVPLALWTFAEATLSRGLFVLVRRGARAADELTAREARTRQEASVSSARRTEKQEYLANCTIPPPPRCSLSGPEW